MRVFSLTSGADKAGIAIGLARAFRRSRTVTLRSMVATSNYLDYPVDEPYDRIRLEELYDDADVVLLHATMHGHRWYDAGQGKPTVLMHHGRTPPEPFLAAAAEAEQVGAVQVGSTIDLTVKAPGVLWAPAPVDIRALAALRRPSGGGRIRVGHAPTNRGLKGTDAFLAAMDRLSRSLDVEPVIIEGLPWDRCLSRKATCDVFYDQAILGYGSNAIEAWAMGIPVLAGVADPDVRATMLATWGRLPFLETSAESIEADLRRMVTDPELRATYAAHGVDHVVRWHSEPAVVRRMSSILRSAGRTAPGGRQRRRTERPLTGLITNT